MLLNINSIRECSKSEGIGKRFAIWTQGCMKRCRNCCNTHMQPIIKKHIIDCDDIIEQIKYSKENYHIEGITLLGGEPILQSKGLAYIAKWCRENNLSVILFSGYTLEEINASNFDRALRIIKIH
ncbi:radical SAM protein [Brachyspira hyodysenteriae]|nr:4Fe-4S cluster-binding domain-containing protein [Brachyspira hyodysenteriae]MDA1467262.1 radical SAM protein [Brachyspira hyodysenteriae]